MLDEHSGEIDVSEARDTFSNIRSTTSPEYFSALVHDVCNRDGLTNRQKYDVLHQVVCRFHYLLTSNAVKHYLDSVDRDLELGVFLFQAFRKLERNDLPLRPKSKEIWIVESLLQAMAIISPVDLKKFAGQVLRKFPKLPGWDPGGKSSGTMRHFENIRRFIKLRKAETYETSLAVLSPVYDISNQVSLKRGQIVINGKNGQKIVPQTKANLRRWTRQVV